MSDSFPRQRSERPSQRPVLAGALREQLARDGALELPAIGASMAKAVPGGSTLRVSPLGRAPRVGELIAFVPTDGPLLCCHRAVATRPDGAVLTQGDRHAAPDGWATPDQVIGVVDSFRLGGREYDLTQGDAQPSRYRIERQRLSRVLDRLLDRS